jgi:Putative metallopeptidase
MFGSQRQSWVLVLRRSQIFLRWCYRPILLQRALVEAAKAWFLTDKRDRREGTQPDAWDAHGMDEQRAYNIVCLMVGSNPEQFKDLAGMTNLPEERRETCKLYDYPVASFSWQKALRPHLRGGEKPRQQIEVTYSPGKDDLAVYEQVFRSVRILEMVANHAAEAYAWPRPLGLETATYGDSGAQFLPPDHKVLLCYELAQEFAQLYRDYGQGWKAPPKEKWWQPKWWKREKG